MADNAEQAKGTPQQVDPADQARQDFLSQFEHYSPEAIQWFNSLQNPGEQEQPPEAQQSPSNSSGTSFVDGLDEPQRALEEAAFLPAQPAIQPKPAPSPNLYPSGLKDELLEEWQSHPGDYAYWLSRYGLLPPRPGEPPPRFWRSPSWERSIRLARSKDRKWG
jgi:hypothetical protein